MRATKWVAVATACLALTACGSTVQVTGTGVPGQQDPSGLGGVVSAPGGTGTPLGSGGQVAPPGSPTSVTTTGGTVRRPATPTGTAAPAEGAVAPPTGAPETGPLRVGFLSVKNDAAASAGIDDGSAFSPRQAFEALVRAYNAKGGLAGRRIVPTYAELRSSSNNYAQDLQAACSTFVQDAHVEAVLGVLGLWSPSLTTCLAKARVPYLSGDYASGDVEALQASPTFVDPGALSLDARLTALLTQVHASGELTSGDKLGLVVEGCPESSRATQRTVLPLLRQLGLSVAKRVDSACFTGLGAFSSQASQMQSAVLDFATAGVTKVAFVSVSAESNQFLLLATAAESQGYRPGYLLTSAAALGVQATNAPRNQLANVKGIGWLPSLDLGQPVGTDATKACTTTLAAQGVKPAGVLDRYFAGTSCDVVGLYARALSVTRGHAGADAVLSALRGLGTAFTSATTLDGGTDLRSVLGGGAARGRRLAFSGGCGCFTYVGSSFALQ